MTIIVADTTCGLPRQLLEERCIPLIPQIVTFSEESYHDDKELDMATFISKLKASPTLPNYELPPAIVVHAGPKAMEVGFFL